MTPERAERGANDLGSRLRSDLAYVFRRVLWFFQGLVARFVKQLLLALALFLGVSLLLPRNWGPALTVTLPFVLAFAPFALAAYRGYRRMRREEVLAEAGREDRERRQLLELARRRGIPAEVFSPPEEASSTPVRALPSGERREPGA